MNIFNKRNHEEKIYGERKVSDRPIDEEDWNINEDELEQEPIKEKKNAGDIKGDTHAYIYKKKENMDREIQEDQKKQEERKNIYILFIIDATYSFSHIFKAVYIALRNLFKEFDSIKQEFPGTKIRFGLMLFRKECSPVYFENELFTEDANTFLTQVKQIEFKGGNLDGYENINEAIEEGVKLLSENTEEEANRAVIVFSDSRSKEKEINIMNKGYLGLRFMVAYLYDIKYYLGVKIVDGSGNIVTDSKKNFGRTKRISEIFSEEGQREMKKLIHDIIVATSVRGRI